VIERFLATPARPLSLVLSQVLRSELTSLIQGAIILVVALPLGATNGGPLGGDPCRGRPDLRRIAGISQGIALLTRKEATMIATANFIGLPLMFVSSMLIARPHPGLDAERLAREPGRVGRAAAREPVLASPEWSRVALFLALLVLFTAATTAFATRCFRAYQRTL
jgi:ABC-2 type transport system permease protein